MNLRQTEEALTRISRTFNEPDHERALELARELKRTLLATPRTDPMLLGWTRFYEFKSLYELARYQEAYELLTSNEPQSWAVSQTNAAYMFSVGSELAMHLDLPDEICRWGGRCLDLRVGASDRMSAAQCAQTVCTLLGRLEREDLNERFATHLIELGRSSGAERPTIVGWRALADNVARCGDAERAKQLVDGLAELQAIDDDRYSDEAMSALDHVSDVIRRTSGGELAANPRAGRDKELFAAAMQGDTSAVTQLIEEGVNVNAGDDFRRTALSHAAFAGHLDTVRALLERGANADLANMQRRTPLVLAADQGHTDVVVRLIEAGADVNHRGIFDQTALILASWQGHIETVRALLDAGADLNVEDCTGNTALTLTATEPQPDVVRLLLEHGAEVDRANTDQQAGQSALFKAAMYGHAEVVEVLLSHGADTTLRDQHGMTAAEWAAQEGFAELANRLAPA